MPKMKTHRSAAKRYRVTRNGKVMHPSPGLRHILTKKGRKRKRQLRGKSTLDHVEQAQIKRLLPYSF
jgi:large subunit ribosomal protein L35